MIRPPGPYKAPRFSPDGRRLALQVSEGGRSRIWLYDIQRAVMSRLTADGPADEVLPLWTPDGRRIVFSSDRDARGEPHLFWEQVDGSDVPSRLTDIPRTEQDLAGSLLSDGETLVFSALNERGGTYSDILKVIGHEEPVLSVPGARSLRDTRLDVGAFLLGAPAPHEEVRRRRACCNKYPGHSSSPVGGNAAA